jgi:hypothetical protein
MDDRGNTKDRLRRLMKHSAEDHRQLLAQLRALETILECHPQPATGDVARKLAELAAAFAAHVPPEEKSDLYNWLPANFADLADELGRCREQHAPLLMSLDQLTTKAESAISAELDTELSVQIRSMVAALRQHEAAESSVLQRALTESRLAG